MEKISIDDIGTASAGIFGTSVLVDGMGGNENAGGFPISDIFGREVFVEPSIPKGNEFHTTLFGECNDVFWSPISTLIEGIDDRFPRINFHNPIEHFGMVDLRNKMVEEGGVDFVGSLDKGRELFTDIFFVGEFGVSHNIDIGVFLEDLEK